MSFHTVSARRQYAIVALVLIAGIAPLSPLIAQALYSNVFAACCLALALALCVRIEHGMDSRSYRLPVRVHPAIVVPMVVLWGLFVFTTLLHPSTTGLKRLPAYLFASVACAFVFPATLTRGRAYHVFAVAGGVLTLIGLPGLVLGTVTIGPLTLSTLPSTYRLAGTFVHNPASVFRQPNGLALLATVGLLSALAVVRWTRNMRGKVIFAVLGGLCAIGIFVTRSRATWAALAAVVALYVVYRVSGRDRRALVGVIAIGIIGAVFVSIALLSGLFDSFPFIRGFAASDRGIAWQAAIEAASRRPFIGWGPGNSGAAVARISPLGAPLTGNSYLRMFAMTGFIGGFAYLALSAGALWCALSRIRSEYGRDTGFAVFSLLVVVVLVQLFQGGTLFGFALLSSLGTLIVGLSQPDTARRTLRVPTVVRQWIHNDTRVRSRND